MTLPLLDQKPARVLTSDDIVHALLDKYSDRDPREGGKWACFVELPNRTGGGDRRCDLFVVGLWASNRRTIAFEVKVSHADFKREIENPTKRAMWEKLATECYFAVPVGLVQPDEIPEGWGLMTVSASGVATRKTARQRQMEPWPVDFAQAIARRAADPVPAFPPGVVELTSGTRLDMPGLRRIVDRLRPPPDVNPEREERARAARDARRSERVELGSLRYLLERHFRTKIRDASHLRELLTRGTVTRDPERAQVLRALADQLDPPGGAR